MGLGGWLIRGVRTDPKNISYYAGGGFVLSCLFGWY